MYPVVEIGGPMDKKTPRIILKAPHFSRFRRKSWGREYWGFREVFMSATESACTKTMQDYA